MNPDSMSEVGTPESRKVQRAGRQPGYLCVSQGILTRQELNEESFFLQRHMVFIWGGQCPGSH